MGLIKTFGKKCVAIQSRTMPPDEVAYGVASDGNLTEVAYDVAQPTKEGQTVHSMLVKWPRQCDRGNYSKGV